MNERDQVDSTLGGDAVASTDRMSDGSLAGQTIGRYSVVRILGEGGMGAVHEAVHQDLKKRVAIKTLHRRISGSPEVRARFLREGQAASRIRHEHVVDVYDVGVDRDIPYLVMEYLEGESFAQLLRREERLPVSRVADLMVPVVAAIAAAHESGIVHRDLKPENVFLCTTQKGVTPKVLDFGISKVVDDGTGHALTGTAAMLGTPLYMSPEQAQDAKSIGPESDQYSLGVILYEASVGKRPFGDETMYSLLSKIVAGTFPAPRKVAPDLPEDWEALVLRAMSRDPAARFPSITALGAALLPFASDRTRLLYEDAFGSEAAVPAVWPSSASASVGAATPGQLSYAGSTTTLGESGTSPKKPAGSRFGIVAGGLGLVVVGALAWVAMRPPAPVAVGVVSSTVPAAAAIPQPTATQAPSAAPAIELVTTVRSEPTGADVFQDGRRVGATPYEVRLAAGASAVQLELRAAGYASKSASVAPGGPTEVSVQLEHAVARPAIPAAPPAHPAPPRLAPR